MRSSRSVVTRSLAVTAALGLALVTAAPASAGGHSILRDGFEGSVPTGPTIAQVKPGGAPWVLDKDSSVRVREDGRISVELEELVIPGRGNPVASMVASLVCQNKVVDSTDPFAVDAEGNGGTEDKVNVPEHCKHPQVLIRSAAADGTPGNYFAFTQDKHHGKHHR